MYLKLHSAVPFFFLFLPGRKKKGKEKKHIVELERPGQPKRKIHFVNRSDPVRY